MLMVGGGFQDGGMTMMIMMIMTLDLRQASVQGDNANLIFGHR